MPGLRVYMAMDIDIDDLVLRPFNELFYEQCEGRPVGFSSHKMPERVHHVWRPLIERLARDPLSLCSSPAAELQSITDMQLRELIKKHVGEGNILCVRVE